MATYSRPDLRNDGMRESSRNHSEGRKPPVRTGYTRTGGNHIRENTVVNTRNSSWTTRHEIRPAPRQEQGNRSGERVSGRKEGRYQAPQPPVRNWEKSASDRRTSPKVNVELNRNRHDNPAPARNTGRTNVKSESKGGQRSAPSHGSRTPSINP
jgi:hypothetical protein